MQKKSILILLGLYIVSSLISFAAFSYLGGNFSTSVSLSPGLETTKSEDQDLIGSLLTISPDDPKDQVCPLNGKYFTEQEKEAWEKKRPLFVMIENSPDARPQSGLADADVVFEAVAEGGVTRFGAIFYCGVQVFDTTLAPIRSARTYFINWASGFNLPLYVHVGGANLPGDTNALGQITSYGWNGENDLNQFSIGYPTFVRDYNRLPGKDIDTEHTMVTTTEKLWAVGEERGWTNMSPDLKYGSKVVPGSDWKDGYTGWSFEDSPSEKGSISKVDYEFWTGYKDYAVSWQYDAERDVFLRSQGGEVHVDLNSDEQIAANNVIVLLTDEEGPLDEKMHMLYRTSGTGDALLFKHGQVYELTWSKKNREAELQFLDKKGNEFKMARGLTWISAVDKSTKVEY